MPRKKIDVSIIRGLGNPETAVVQKSLTLFSLWRSDLSLSAFKILDIYLSRINSHCPEQRTVVFAKGELERVLGVKKINKSELDPIFESLGKLVKVEDSRRKLKWIALFEQVDLDFYEDGLCTFALSCTDSAMEYFFNVENIGYLRYKLRSIVHLKSRYSYVLFCYLENNRYRGTWEVDVDTLKSVLNCDKEPTYTEYKRFNDMVLKRCRDELNQNTECRFDYTPVKRGRKVIAIRFTLYNIDCMEDKNQCRIDDSFFASALPPELSPEQVEELRTLVVTSGIYRRTADPSKPEDVQIYDYLHSLSIRLSHHPKVRCKFRYLLQTVKNDIKDQ